MQQAQQNNTKLWIGDLADKQLGESLGLDINSPIKITMRGDSITHILKRHGIDSINAKNGQPPTTYQDLRQHQEIINNPDLRLIQQKNNQNILISGKQVNGYYVVVETISTKDNELKLKTMYKENGDLTNNPIFTKTLQDQQSGGESLGNPSNPLDKASGFSEDIIPQPQIQKTTQPLSNPTEQKTLNRDSENNTGKAGSGSKEVEGIEGADNGTQPNITKVEEGERLGQVTPPSQNPQLSYETKEIKGMADLRASLKQALSPYISQEIINKQTGFKGIIANTEINKISSKKAIDKSIENGFSRDEHFKAGENIKELFENASLKSTQSDKNQSPHLRAIYRFDSPLIINNKEANALITLKESVEQGKKDLFFRIRGINPLA